MRRFYFLLAILVVILSPACNKNLVQDNDAQEPEYYEVKLGMSGAITSELFPFTKSEGNDQLIGISIWSSPEDSDNYSYYAVGLFDSFDITVKLLKGYKYKFSARSVENGKELYKYSSRPTEVYYRGPFDAWTQGHCIFMECKNEFIYGEYYLSKSLNDHIPGDMYYGEYTDYSPVENGSVTIEMERVSFGINITAQNLTEGYVNVKLAQLGDIKIEYPTTSFGTAEYIPLYFMASYSEADYYEEINVSAVFVNTDNVSIPLGETTIKVMKNKLTKIKINAAAPSEESSFDLQYSTDEMVDDEEDTYGIGGDGTEDIEIN